MLTVEFLTLGWLKSLQFSSILSCVYAKGWEGRRAAACVFTVPGDGVLIIAEESSGKYLHLVITFWLSGFAVAFISPGSVVIKLFFFSHLDLSSTSIFTVWYLSFFAIQAATKQAILINNPSVPTGRDEELVPSAHASNDAAFCIFSK